MTEIITRFAPSPTGFLHIGGARTALFNFLYARHCNGKYLLRIEDTDKKRSTTEAIDAILNGLQWLGLQGDEPTIFQSQNIQHHRSIAEKLIQQNKAYYCYCSPEELQQRRENALANKTSPAYNRQCRELKSPPNDRKPSIRIKAPLLDNSNQAKGSTIEDIVQGKVSVPENILDDFIILRQDGTPTYMFSVVVDDHSMGITHIIRGDDHLNNAHRQKVVFDACGWECPQFAHIPLLHGDDGKKLSKRHGALAVSSYKDMGYLPQALSNYIMRLGWGHGDDEIISYEQAIQFFDIADVSHGASRFDFKKLDFVNSRYLQASSESDLLKSMRDFLPQYDESQEQILLRAFVGLKSRCVTLCELSEACDFYLSPVIYPLEDNDSMDLLRRSEEVLVIANESLALCSDWSQDSLKLLLSELSDRFGEGMKYVMLPLRLSLSGRSSSPGVAEMLWSFGRDESLYRIGECINFLRG